MSLFSSLVTSVNPYMLYIKIGAAVLAAGAVFGFYLWVHHAFVERAALKVKVTELTGQITAQNAAIDKWKKDATDATQKVMEYQKQSAKVQVVYRTKVERIMAASIPKACPDAVKWGAVQGAVAGKDWESGK